MKNKFALALAGLLAISSATFAADERDHGYRGDDHRGRYHENYRGHDRDYHDRDYHDYGHYDRDRYRNYGYRGGGAVYLGVVAPAPYVDSYSYATPNEYGYAGPPPFAGAIWIGGNWCYGPRGRYWVRGHWEHRR